MIFKYRFAYFVKNRNVYLSCRDDPGSCQRRWQRVDCDPRASLVAQVVQNLPANARDVGLFPGSGRSLEEVTATCSNILAWRIPWTEEPGQTTVHGVTKSWRQLK